jgi:putative integral membrane protein (TIGR02587 family)
MSGWADERDAFIRAFAGAYIFGIPLLFTMEMWWIGQYIGPWKLVAFICIALVANFGLSYVAGFKSGASLLVHIDEAIDAVAVGIVGAAIVLVVLNQVTPADPLSEALGKIALQAVPLSIGASVANQVFRRGDGNGRTGTEGDEGLSTWQMLLNDIGATAAGGVFIGVSIAPTEEIPMIAAAMSQGHLLAIVGFSLLISYGIVFASGFDTAQGEGLFQHPFSETMLAYVVSLSVSFGALYLFGQIRLDDPLLSIVEQVIVLGVPATVGGAAGRLVI